MGKTSSKQLLYQAIKANKVHKIENTVGKDKELYANHQTLYVAAYYGNYFAAKLLIEVRV